MTWYNVRRKNCVSGTPVITTVVSRCLFPLFLYGKWEHSTSHNNICAYFFVVIVVILKFLVDLCDLFTHIFQGYFTGTGAIWLPQCQWSNLEGYGWKGSLPNHNTKQQSMTHIHSSRCVVHFGKPGHYLPWYLATDTLDLVGSSSSIMSWWLAR